MRELPLEFKGKVLFDVDSPLFLYRLTVFQGLYGFPLCVSISGVSGDIYIMVSFETIQDVSSPTY